MDLKSYSINDHSKMDLPSLPNVKAPPAASAADFYLNRLIQLALRVDGKPLIQIYEEECRRYPDISVTVTFKAFQSALQNYCDSMRAAQSRARALNAAAAQQQDAAHLNNNGRNARFNMEMFNLRKRRRSDAQVPTYLPQQQLRFRGLVPTPPPVVNIKSEDSSHSATIHPPAARPPSLPTPLAEEEAAPEFIEMSSHPPKLSANIGFAGSSLFSPGESGLPAVGPCKTEPRDGMMPPTYGSVQSSSPLDHAAVATEDVSPLNVRCVKCVTTRVTCAVMPCGHCCLCATCGQTALSLKQVCPVCRKSITTVIGYSNLIYNLYR